MVAWLGNADGDARQQWTDALEGAPTAFDGLVPIHDATSVQGRLVGGNLAVLAALAGTPHAPPLDDAVLLLEEVGEAPYRIDRMLTTLRQAGWFDRVAGVLVGALHQCEGRYDTSAEDVVRAHFRSGSCPAWLGAPVGHGPQNAAVPLGALLEIDGGCARVLPAA
jgi:muramoyltetrapeptide carboxypeptidase